MKFLFTFLLNILGILYLVGVIVVPTLPEYKNDSRVDSLLGMVLCEPGERLVREPVAGILSGVGIAMTPYCVNGQQRRDVTTRWLVIGLGGFGVLMLFTTLLEIALVMNGIRRGVARSLAPRSPASPMSPIPPADNKAGLRDKLKQLEDARRAGLITVDEYDRLRANLLDELAE